jgi:hypothetical protein
MAVAVSQLLGLHSNPVDGLASHGRCCTYRLVYWLQRLLFRWHQCSMVPVVNGVTLVLVVVAATLIVSSMRSMPLLPYCLRQQLPMDRLLHRLDCLLL